MKSVGLGVMVVLSLLIGGSAVRGEGVTGEDPFLRKIKDALPKNWTMSMDASHLVLERIGEVEITMENRINAPGGPPGQIGAVPPDGGTGRRGRTRVLFPLRPRMAADELENIQTANDAVYNQIEALPEQLEMGHLVNRNPNAKGGMFKYPQTPQDEEKLRQYEAKRAELEKSLKKMPEYQSRDFCFFGDTMEGVDDELQRVTPPEATPEAYAVADLVRKSLESVRGDDR
jgi:hypothetical protein